MLLRHFHFLKQFLGLKPFGLAFGFIFGLCTCSSLSGRNQENPFLHLSSEVEYLERVQEQTRSTEIYDGFLNTMSLSATFLNSDLTLKQVDQNARIFQWKGDTYKKEIAEAETSLRSQTVIFLSFYVPERKHDDLHKISTKWKIYLDLRGRRYEGKVEKSKALLSETQSLYPHHNRWSSPYRLIFPLPVAQAEDGEITLTVTGPVGQASLTWSSRPPSSLAASLHF